MSKIRINAFSRGRTDYPSGAFTVDAKFGRGMVKAFEYFRDRYGYYPPYTAEHPPIELYDLLELDPSEVELEGVNYGRVIDIEILEDKSIDLIVDLNELGEKLHSLKALDYHSPCFYRDFTDPHSNRTFGPVLRELSAVTVPHQKNLSTDHRVSLGEFQMMPATVALSDLGFDHEDIMRVKKKAPAVTTAEMPEEEKEESIETAEEDEAAAVPAPVAAMDAAGIGMLEEISAKLNELLAALGAPDDSATDEPVEMGETIEALRLEVRTLRAENQVAKDHPGADPDRIKALTTVLLADASAYEVLSQTPAPVAASETATATTGTAHAAPAPAVSLSEARAVKLCNAAASEGIRRGKPLVSYLMAQGLSKQEVDTVLSEHRETLKNAYAAR